MSVTTATDPPPRTTLAAIESLAIPLVQEVVFMADFRCAKCQHRVARFMSKMEGETQSVTISVLEKKVTLTCTNSSADKLPRRKNASAHRSSWSFFHSAKKREPFGQLKSNQKLKQDNVTVNTNIA